MAAERIRAGTVSEIFAEGLSFTRKYKIVYHRDKKLTAAALDFLAICRKNTENGESY